ncbi:iron-only hydrogenase group A [Sporomusaceae bacterium BoRhaA]|uniref:[FeFe] hydrogenase, group A n=1 Tax=Pelorhabdus rhamnosifermentans TaxID=2772457 RepID=UPI002484B299|nr:[FeFe] hydrogenase, group A [Pelorhabdus rhamnosifermentans]MBU2703105.1 iron-only hydrogenase group A [Pelorhabdus rhamnosifermentans]
MDEDIVRMTTADVARIIHIDQELCTGCQRCVAICPVDAIKGQKGQPQTICQERCVACGQCVQICSAYASIFDEDIAPREQKIAERGLLSSVKEPLFASYNCGDALKVKAALADSQLFTMVQCAPAVRVAIAEEFGLPWGSLVPGKIAAALRKLGCNRVYDTNFAADLTIMEEGSELIQRVTAGGTLPMFTSCCPAWVKYVEQTYPELIPHLSSCKSPQQMAGAIFKTYGTKVDRVEAERVFSISVMPCTCKKFECGRPEMDDSGYRDVDVVITTRELAQLIKDAEIDFLHLPEEEFDKPLGTYTGAASLFGVSGGVMEAALRTSYKLITRESIPEISIRSVRGGAGIRKASVKVGNWTLKVVVVSGLKNAKTVMEQIKAGKADFQFMEVMCCPAGCVSGGGQPKVLLPSDRPGAYVGRAANTYAHDENLRIRESHNNPDVQKLYKFFLGEPLGHESHHLLHTQYTSRK